MTEGDWSYQHIRTCTHTTHMHTHYTHAYIHTTHRHKQKKKERSMPAYNKDLIKSIYRGQFIDEETKAQIIYMMNLIYSR